MTSRLFLLRAAILKLCTGQIIRSLKRNTRSYKIRTFCILLTLSLEGTKNGTWPFFICTLRCHCTRTQCSWLTRHAGKRIVIAKKKKYSFRIQVFIQVGYFPLGSDKFGAQAKPCMKQRFPRCESMFMLQLS